MSMLIILAVYTAFWAEFTCELLVSIHSIERDGHFHFARGHVFMTLIVLGFMDDWIWVDVVIGDDIVIPILSCTICFGLDSSPFLAITTMLNCVCRLNGMDMEIMLKDWIQVILKNSFLHSCQTTSLVTRREIRTESLRLIIRVERASFCQPRRCHFLAAWQSSFRSQGAQF